MQSKPSTADLATNRDSRAKYIAVCQALLKVIPDDEYGVPFGALAQRVAEILPQQTLDELGSVTWWTNTVKLDMEARGLIETVPRVQPLRIRRIRE